MRMQKRLKVLTISVAAVNAVCAIAMNGATAVDLRSRNVIEFKGGAGSPASLPH